MELTKEQKDDIQNYLNLCDTRPTYKDAEGKTIVSVSEVAYFFYSIPKGMVTTWEAVHDYFAKKYGDNIQLSLSKNFSASIPPYWKAVSERGYLTDYGVYYTKDEQREKLKSIGIELDEKNRVVNFKDKLFVG